MTSAPLSVRQGLVTPVGSCRIATPLKQAAEAYGFRYNRGRSFGFTHSSAEAVQIVRYMMGEIRPPEDIWPLISQTNYASVEAETHATSDVYVVEICSAKELRIGDWLVQLNYLVRRYPDFFGDTSRRGAFWRVAESNDPDAIDRFLREEWSATETQRAEARALGKISLHMATEEDLERDMRWLLDRLPEVVFVTHIDALGEAGTPIRSRSELISCVETVARRLGARVFNPTGAMLNWGQAEALEPDSKSFAHYTDAFSQRVGDLMVSEGISGGLIRAAVRRHDDEAMVLAHLARRDASGNLEQLEPILSWALNERPDWLDLDYWYLRLMLMTRRADRVAAFIRSGRLDVQSDDRQREIARLCADKDDFGLLALIHERLPEACSDLSHLTRLRLAGGKDTLNLPPADDTLASAERLEQAGQFRIALAMLLEEHPEAKARLVESPALIEAINRLVKRLPLDQPAADLGQWLILLDNAGIEGEPLRVLRRAFQTAVRDEVKMAQASGDVWALVALETSLGKAVTYTPTLHLAVARAAFASGEYNLCLSKARAAASVAPDDAEPLVLAMRSAGRLHDIFSSCAMALSILELVKEPGHRYRVEAETHLTRSPRLFYRAASEAPDPIVAIEMFREAMKDHELEERARKKAGQLERQFLQTARERLLANDQTLILDLGKARRVISDNPRLDFLAGRWLMQNRDFKAAMHCWQRLIDKNPDDTGARTELERCRARLG